MGQTQGRDAQSNAINAAEVEQIFLKAGKMRAIHPGEVLIEQGASMSNLYLIMSGELVLTQMLSNGKDAKEVGRRNKGDVIGELSFLLDSQPTVSVSAPEASRDVTVVEVTHMHAIATLQKDPRFAAKVFQMVATLLAARLDKTSSSKKNSAASQHSLKNGTAETSIQHAQMLGEKVLPSKFELDDECTEFVLQATCDVVIETPGDHSEPQHQPGTLVLFSTHLCLELSALNFTRHVVVPFADVQRVEHDESSSTPVAIVFAKGTKYLIGLAADLFVEISRRIELLRLESIDTTMITEAEVHSGVASSLDEKNQGIKLQNKELGELGESSIAVPELPAVLRRDSLDEAGEVIEEGRASAGTDVSVTSVMGKLSQSEWTMLMKHAEVWSLEHGATIIQEGEKTRALHQLIRGTAAVEMHVHGRPQAVVLARKQPGDIFGEKSLLLGTPAGSSVVVESDHATVLRLKHTQLQQLFTSAHPGLPGKFYFFIALDQARRLQALTTDLESAAEVVIEAHTTAPTTIRQIVDNPAFMWILDNFVHVHMDELLTDQEKKAATLLGKEDRLPSKAYGPAIEFIVEHLELEQATYEQVPSVAMALCARYISAPGRGNASKTLTFVSKRLKAETEKHARDLDKDDDFSEEHQAEREQLCDKVRESFAVVAMTASKLIDTHVMKSFLNSPPYQYILDLKGREKRTLSMTEFKTVRVLNEGQFGQLLEVVKRDCGRRYVVKAWSKAKLKAVFGEKKEWLKYMLQQRDLMTTLHHPRITNLAYCFHTTGEAGALMMVFDGVSEVSLHHCLAQTDEELTPKQICFVAKEVVIVLEYLHAHHICHRDLKPEHLLVDKDGHVLITDFSRAATGGERMPELMDMVGTPGFMAPEVLACAAKQRKECSDKMLAGLPEKYGVAADWWACGVIVYELSERALPFGDEPTLASMHAEHGALMSKLTKLAGRAGSGGDLMCGLLEWKPDKRLSAGGAVAVKKADFFKSIDWSASLARKEPSPLKTFKWWKDAYKKNKAGAAGGGGVKNRRSLFVQSDGHVDTDKETSAPMSPRTAAVAGAQAPKVPTTSGAGATTAKPAPSESHRKPAAPGESHRKPATPGESHRKPATPGESHRKPAAPGESHRKPAAPGESHRKPAAPGESHRKALPVAHGEPHRKPLGHGAPAAAPSKDRTATPDGAKPHKSVSVAPTSKGGGAHTPRTTKKQSAEDQALLETWDYTCPRAIAQEFVSQKAAQVSLL